MKCLMILKKVVKFIETTINRIAKTNTGEQHKNPFYILLYRFIQSLTRPDLTSATHP